VLGSVMVPTTALAIPTYLMFSELGLTNNPLSIILPSLVSPFGVYLMRIYAEAAVPSDLIEAARIDGAGEFRIFGRIAFRLLAPAFVTVLLFNFVATWNNYFLPLVMLSEPRWYPLTVGLAQWNSQATASGGATSAFTTVITGSLISVVPLIIAFVFLQRYWQSGLGAGGVKG
jgi:multiple sugar transport system permease protein